MKKDKLLFLSVATTGFNSADHGILSISYRIRVPSQNILSSVYTHFVNPQQYKRERVISIQALKYNNLSLADLKNFDTPVGVLTKFHDTLLSYTSEDDTEPFVVCGFNVNFDLGFLRELYAEGGIEDKMSQVLSNKTLDLYELCKWMKFFEGGPLVGSKLNLSNLAPDSRDVTGSKKKLAQIMWLANTIEKKQEIKDEETESESSAD